MNKIDDLRRIFPNPEFPYPSTCCRVILLKFEVFVHNN